MLPPKSRCYIDRLLAACLAALVFWSPCVPLVARAQDSAFRERLMESEVTPQAEALENTSEESSAEPSEEVRDRLLDTEVGQKAGDAMENEVAAGDEPESAEADESETQPLNLPTGPAKSGVTPQSIALPKGEGSIEGMGESFTANLSSGTGTFSVPIALPRGRAGVGPSLGLSYSTSGGNGPLGIGWSMGTPFISRQTDKGLPRYRDQAAWHEEEDRFMYNGGQELVPVDSAAATAVDGAPVPVYAQGWQQYRARVEGAFMRFFRAPDSSRWIVQSKDGTLFELGACVDALGRCDGRAVEADPEDPSRIFAWQLVRMSDVHGSAVHYRYLEDGGQLYLSDIYYDSPARCGVASVVGRRGCSASFAEYGRRVHLDYEGRKDVTTSFIRTWETSTALRLERITVTSAQGSVGSRFLVRRYHLAYDSESFHSLLTSVQVEGRPSRYDASLGVFRGRTDISEASLGAAMVGDLLPPMRFSYTGVRSTAGVSVPGFGALDGTIHDSPASPRHSVDEARTDLFDVNSDGLPDLVVTDPARFEGGAGVYFNGFSGMRPSEPGSFSTPVRVGLPSGMSGVMTLSNVNILPMDVDGDGRTDLLNMPRERRYGYFAVSKTPATSRYEPLKGFSFQYIERDLGQGLDPRIDLGRDGRSIKTVDVNHDSLIDVVQTTGTKIHTWLNLGFTPGGDGRFGSARFDGRRWQLSTEPVDTCLPVAGRTLDLSDEGVRFSDMNGDGLVDIVRVGFGEVVYWPSRGEGAWGRGKSTCDQSNRAQRHVSMVDAPRDINVELDGVHLIDINSDGASDIVQVGTTEISVWFNRAGHGFTERAIVDDTPFRASVMDRVRIADIDGSGTTDIIYGSANGYQWLDLAGGQRPRLLETVDNGLGALTTLTYGSSAEDYLRDLREATSCDPQELDCFTWHREPRASATQGPACDDKGGGCIHHPSGSPVVSTVVRAITNTDRFDAFGLPASVTESRYRYHDAYYEGIEQEFRGFGAADVESVGDVYEPTSITSTYFHQGRRPNAIAADRLADNPNEALKGREFLTETRDPQTGVFVSSSHATYAVRKLLTGLNGVAVSHASVKRTDEFRYDTGSWAPSSERASLPSVVREEAGTGLTSVSATSGNEGDAPHRVQLRGENPIRLETTYDEVDNLGNVRRQTAWGQNGRGSSLDERITKVTLPLRVDDSACGGGGWLWRTGESHVEGHGDGGFELKKSISSYDACGNQVRMDSPAQLPASPRFMFDGPSDTLSYSQTDLVHISSSRNDVWGQPLESCMGADLRSAGRADCDRYTSFQYDAAYGSFVERESIAAATSGRAATLTTSARWDQGLGQAEATTDPNGYVSEVFYDGLARMTGSVLPNVKGCEGSRVPTQRIFYEFTSDPIAQPINRVRTITELSCAGIESNMQQGYAFIDGLGRTRATLSQNDPEPSSSEDGRGHAWTKAGIDRLNRKGKPFAVYESYTYDGATSNFAAILAPPPRSAVVRYADAFGRPRYTVERDGVILSETRYHALSTEVWDSIDLGLDPSAPWCFTGTYTLNEIDGHGRSIHQRLHQRRASCNDQPEYHHLYSYYRADGAVTKVVRALAPRDALRPVGGHEGLTKWTQRTFVYDSQGRRVASFDPNTDNAAQADEGRRTWRYLFNRAGDVAAIRDPRGCGQNFFYDLAGRLIGEQYVRCDEAQRQTEAIVDTVPIGAMGQTRLTAPVDVHVRYYFDEYPGWSSSWRVPGDRLKVLGRETGSADRAKRSVVGYDARGLAIYAARQLAMISRPGSYVASGSQTGLFPSFVEGVEAARTTAFDLQLYESRSEHDHAGRSLSNELPADPSFVGGAAPMIGSALEYDRAGRPRRATALIGAARYDVVSNIRYTHDHLPSETTYGDGRPGRQATVSAQVYDVRRRPTDMYTLRSPTSTDAETLGAVSVVTDQRLHWDTVNNLAGVYDERPGAEWPDGHRPQTAELTRDALYHIEQIDHRYTGDDDGLSPFDDASDWRMTAADHRAADPMKERPAPMLARPTAHRVVQLKYSHDWLANVVSHTDDAGQFYERSLGAIANGNDLTTTVLRPSALYVASSLSTSTPSDRGGWLELGYGSGGNVTSMTVHAQCTDRGPLVCANPTGTSVDARRNVLRNNCACAAEQHYSYRYDELNRLSEARRFDRESGAWTLKTRQRYRYDGANQRSIKETIDVTNNDTRVALYVIPGDFERRGLRASDNTYENIAGESESQYLIAGARLVWQTSASPASGLDPDHRITFAVTDLIQSTSAVIDLMSGELLESTAFYPNGGREHWLDSSAIGAASVPLETVGFTGKEGDDEVGLTYFGERYLIQHIGRWATPDPLAIHASEGGEVLNAYHYVSGNLLQGRDPLGLEEPKPAASQTNTSGGEIALDGTRSGGCVDPTPPAAAPPEPTWTQRAAQWTGDKILAVGEFIWNAPEMAKEAFLGSVPPSAVDYARRGTPEFSGAEQSAAGGAEVLQHTSNRIAKQNEVAMAHLSFWANSYASSVAGLLEVGGGFTSLAHYGLSLGPTRLRPPTIGMDGPAGGVQPGAIRAGSTSPSMESLMHSLRQNGSPEALATASLIKRGETVVEFLPGLGPNGEGALQPFGTNRLVLYRGGMSTADDAASLAVHETKHFLQGITRSTYHLGHEVEAYAWQAKAMNNGHFNLGQIWKQVRANPIYSGVREPPKGWKPNI